MVNVRHLLLFIVIKLLFLCCQSQPYTPEIKNECYMSTIGLNVKTFRRYKECPKLNDPIELNFNPGNVEGSMVAKFRLAHPLCFQTAYKIELQYAEEGNKTENCSEPSSIVSHSERKFSILTCDGNCTNACGEYGKVQFFNMARGCYKAKVTQYINQNFKNRITNWTSTGRNESETWVMRVDINDIVLFSRGMNISMKFSKPTSYVIIKLMNNETAEEMDMSKLLENKGCHFLKSETNTGNITKYDGLSCSFSGLSNNYTLIEAKVFKDEQCDEEIKYKKKSYQDHRVCWIKERRGVPVNNKVTEERYNNWILFGIVVSSFFVVMTVSRIIFKQLLKRRSRSSSSIGEPALLAQDTMSNDYEILLLYAKDCKEFMVTMESFRHMLGELCNVKVYDCYDELNREDEQIKPHDWLERIMKFKPSLHIILVSTLSACIQRQGYLSGAMNGKASAFKDPSYLDKVFLYGLNIIREYEMPNHHPYGKIFIIQLNGFSDDADLKKLSTLKRVYQIPLHLELLIRDMKMASSKKQFHKKDDLKINHPRIEINQEKNSDELIDITIGENYDKFLCQLVRLNNFKKNNPNYLTDMFEPIILNHNTYRRNK